MGDVKLHGFWYSPYTMRVVWTLKLKGIPYENIEEDRSNKSPKLLEYNPVYKKAPVLVHNGKPICESLLIVEYIDEIWPHTSLLPADPHERAVARFWAKYTDETVPGLVALIYSTNSEEREKAIEKLVEPLRVIEDQCLSDDKKTFIGGDTINIADIALGSILKLVEVSEGIFEVKILQDEKFPHLNSWYNDFKDIPVINENLPDHEETVAIFKFIREKVLGSSEENRNT